MSPLAFLVQFLILVSSTTAAEEGTIRNTKMTTEISRYANDSVVLDWLLSASSPLCFSAPMLSLDPFRVDVSDNRSIRISESMAKPSYTKDKVKQEKKTAKPNPAMVARVRMDRFADLYVYVAMLVAVAVVNLILLDFTFGSSGNDNSEYVFVPARLTQSAPAGMARARDAAGSDDEEDSATEC